MKKYRYLILAALILCFAGGVILLWQPLMDFVADPKQLHIWVKQNGAWGVFVFALLNALQVIIAVIPGGPFEVAAGYMFGAVWGTLLCDVAMTLGSVIVFLLVRKFGMPFVLLFFKQEQIDSIHLLKDKERLRTILFFLFLIPGTPKDLITYLVGLTELPVSSLIFVCFVGRLPAILFSALGGSALDGAQYGIVVAVAVVLVVSYILGTLLYQKWNNRKGV